MLTDSIVRLDCRRGVPRALGIAAALGFALLGGLGCGATTRPCNHSTCSGCCDQSGTCQSGALATACGTAGMMCMACAPGHVCQAGACGESTGNATGGGAGGGGAAGGGGGAGGGDGGPLCSDLSVPVSAASVAFYAKDTNEETYSTREWTDGTGQNVLSVVSEWSLASNPVVFPVVSSVSGGQTASWVVMFFWRGCSIDLSSCLKRYTIYDGTITVAAETRAPQGAITATSAAVSLQEADEAGYVLPGTCVNVPPLDWSSTYVCLSNGVACQLASDCCSNICQSGKCAATACRTDGTSCSAASQCCSSQCSNAVCGAPTCKADGLSCTSASQCCTSQCSSGVCGAPTCKADGLSCTAASQCCTSQCSSGVCGAPTCKADGLSCTSASQCCTSQCSSGVCGAPTCKADGLSCTSASQCCTSQCNSGVCGATTCKADGLSCTSASQCCSWSCSAGYCGTDTSSCDPVANTGCVTPNECILLSSEETVCALAGSGRQGASCSSSVLCAGGYACFGTCRKICLKATGAGCPVGTTCTGVMGWTTYGACG